MPDADLPHWQLDTIDPGIDSAAYQGDRRALDGSGASAGERVERYEALAGRMTP